MPDLSLDDLAAAVAVRATGPRLVVGISGPPGAGKSTIAEALRARLIAQAIATEILPMDGYHYDDRVLGPLGLSPRKGAPETFDVEGFAVMLGRLATDSPRDVAVPVFDRELEIARGAARIIPAATRIVLVEGNYLLLDEAPWSSLRPMFDLTVAIQAGMDELRRRLIGRWRGYGFLAAEALAKAEGNDLPNARRVIETSAPADLTIACDVVIN